jgi:hypothetical protein
VRIKHPVAEELRRAFGARTSRIDLRDVNAGRQLVSAATNSAYSIRVAMIVADRKTQVYIGKELACISVFAKFDVPRFTVNAADRCGFKSQRAGNVQIGAVTVEVYTEEGTLAEVQKHVLNSEEMRTLVASHTFRSGEAMHFYRNVLVLYARNEDITPELVAKVNMVANIVPTSTAS